MRWLSERKKKKYLRYHVTYRRKRRKKSHLQEWRSSGDATQHLALVASLSYSGNF